MSQHQHIYKFLKYYCNLNVPPNYAVMLEGAWGSGKTWFINDFRKNFPLSNSQNSESIFIYTSFYGITSFDEIDDALFWESLKHRKILNNFKGSSQATILGQEVLQSLASAYSKTKLPLKELKKVLRSLEGKILIFDDIERAEIPINQILSFINKFVEHENLKVIILCNEEAISQQGEKSDNSYSRIKEKVIGRTFKIEPNVEIALSAFLHEVTPPEASQFLKEHTDIVSRVFAEVKYQNLRHLRQTLLEFGRFYVQLDDKFRNEKALMQSLIQEFMRFSIEVIAGRAFVNDFEMGKIIKAYTSIRLRARNETNTEGQSDASNQLQDFLGKYNYDNCNTLITWKLWQDFFRFGIVPVNELHECLNNSEYFLHEKVQAWQRLWAYESLTDEEFNQYLSSLEEQWKNFAFQEPVEILHVAGLFLEFASIGVENFTKTKQEVVEDCTKYIQNVSKSQFAKSDDLSQSIRLDKSVGYSLGYWQRDTQEFHKIYDSLYETIQQTRFGLLREVAENLLNKLQDDPDEFGYMLCSESSYLMRLPVLEYVDINKFMAQLSKHRLSIYRDIIRDLEKRYRYKSVEISSEHGFITGFREKLQNLVIDVKPHQYLSRAMIGQYIQQLKEIENNLQEVIP